MKSNINRTIMECLPAARYPPRFRRRHYPGGRIEGRGRRRLRRHRLRLHRSGRRQPHLRAVRADAQPGQRQGRRHRGRGPVHASDLGVSREILDDDYLLQMAFLGPAGAGSRWSRPCVTPFLESTAPEKSPLRRLPGYRGSGDPAPGCLALLRAGAGAMSCRDFIQPNASCRAGACARRKTSSSTRIRTA